MSCCSTTSSGCSRPAATTSTSSPRWSTAAWRSSSCRTCSPTWWPFPKRVTGCWTARSPTIWSAPGLTHEIRAWLSELAPDRLAEFLIGGVAYQDVPDEVGGSFLSAFRELDPAGFVLRPLPNTQFMRDNTAWIFGGVTLNPMYWPARRQETLLTTAVYKFHPAFADEKFDVWLGDVEGVARDHGMATLEGGDVMPIGKGIVVIGMGERSSHQAITQVARNLFAAGAAERVIVASLPKTRAAMHLDTVFTFCDHDLVTAYAPIVDGIVPFSLRPDDSSPSGLDIRREPKGLISHHR